MEKIVMKVPMDKEDQKELEKTKKEMKKKGRLVEFMFLAL